MFQTKKTYVSAEMRMSELIFENPSFLTMMEHFNLDMATQDKSVEQICQENRINKEVFIAIANLYNGFNPEGIEHFETDDVKTMIAFLENSHQFYLNEKIPEIRDIVDHLFIIETNKRTEITLIEKFFSEYTREVEEHLQYEDHIAFPYFMELLSPKCDCKKTRKKFSVKEYQEHHTDIETKLNDLKKLLVKHISLKDNRSLKRKLLINLFELEYDLNIHSMIEELMLMPLITKTERRISHG
ncbi:MAG: hemerythrin domain-containing protein [Prolixibacteraceae bacterium]